MAGELRRRVFRYGRWAVFALAGFVLAVALLNLGLTGAFLIKERQLGRLALDARRLALSGPPADSAQAVERYRRLYAAALGPEPDPAAIRRYLESRILSGGPLVLDQVMVEYIRARWGAVDGRSLPPGVYVGARAIGPDTPPLSRVTKYLAHYAVYVRHGYVLVVPEPGAGGAPLEFSASRTSDFAPDADHPHSLMIRPEPFAPGAYDFPSRGQAIHELYRLSSDPKIIEATGPQLRALAEALHGTGAQYGLFGQNSNTVLGCMLQASDLHRGSFQALRQDRLLSLRLIGIGSPLWSQPLSRPASARCG